jgi:hypothetical protein
MNKFNTCENPDEVIILCGTVEKLILRGISVLAAIYFHLEVKFKQNGYSRESKLTIV